MRTVQEVRVGTGKNAEVRTLSFRALDIEQIGYVYEGLLSYGGERAVEHMAGLIGPEGLEHEVPLRELSVLATMSGGSVKALAKSVHEKWKEPKPPATAAKARVGRAAHASPPRELLSCLARGAVGDGQGVRASPSRLACSGVTPKMSTAW
ncbi:hypothetical protein [Streptomyces sp. NPDC001880]